ncbi:hypothetical protein B0H14DRAFT_1190644 [Mycena olivaceomarginata]|nr:hypothetical protein B0H14DRAFT_1190644 [Mycena olivaceomarginata]
MYRRSQSIIPCGYPTAETVRRVYRYSPPAVCFPAVARPPPPLYRAVHLQRRQPRRARVPACACAALLWRAGLTGSGCPRLPLPWNRCKHARLAELVPPHIAHAHARGHRASRPAPSRGSTPGFCARTRAGSMMHGTAGVGSPSRSRRNASRSCEVTHPAPSRGSTPGFCARTRAGSTMHGTAGVGSPSRLRRNASRSCEVTHPAPSRGSTPGCCAHTRAGSTMHGTAGVGSPSRSRRNTSRSCEVTHPAPSRGSTPGCCARTRAGSTMRGTLGVGSPSRSRRNTSRSCEATLGDRRCPCVCPCVRSGDRRWAWGWRWRWRQTAAVHTPRLSVTGQFPGSRCGWC